MNIKFQNHYVRENFFNAALGGCISLTMKEKADLISLNMKSSELCSKCKAIELHRFLQDAYEFWVEDKSEPQRKTLSRWHPKLEDLVRSSMHCRLCKEILQALEDDLQSVADGLVRSGDMPIEDREQYTGGLLTISKYAVYHLEVELFYESKGVQGPGAHAFLQVTLKPDPPSYSSWEPGDLAALFRIVTSHHTTEAEATLGNGIELDPASEQTFSKIRSWLDACSKDHKNCPKSRGNASLPTRVLDVGNFDSNKIYLRESVTITDQSAQYVALSHCWGVERTLEKLTKRTQSLSLDHAHSADTLDGYWKVRQESQTTIETLPARLNGVEIDALPQTAQDAILVTRKLGLSYLWIDSLCIIQDDKKDWLQESAKMASVYLNAHLVIGASNSLADYDGFLHKRAEPNMVKFNNQLPNGTNTYLGLQPLPPRPKRWKLVGSSEISGVDPLGQEPLAHRAWCLQERYLARRMVLYGTEQVFWECAELLAAEDGNYVTRDDDYLEELKATASIKPTIFEPRSDGDHKINYRNWYEMVEKYMSCAITKGSDRLPALAGLATAVASSSGDEYLAGIWRTGLIEGLLWSKKEASKNALRRPDNFRAPSWSWASVDGKVRFSVYNFIERCAWKRGIADYEALATYVKHKIIPEGSNTYGGVQSAYLQLTAPLLNVSSMELSKPNPMSYVMVPFTSPSCDRVFGLRIGSRSIYIEGGFDVEEHDATNLSVILLARLPDGNIGFDPFLDIRFGLILEPTSKEGVYRRVGIIDGPILMDESTGDSAETDTASVAGKREDERRIWEPQLFSPDHPLDEGDEGPEEMPSDPLLEIRDHMVTVTLV